MKLSFKHRLWMPLVISLIALLAISILDIIQARDIRIEERKKDLVNVAQVAMSTIKE